MTEIVSLKMPAQTDGSATSSRRGSASTMTANSRPKTLDIGQSIERMETNATQVITTTTLGGLQFKEREIEKSFGHYWSDRYGLPMKTSMFMLLVLSIMMQCLYPRLIETNAQSILTCVIMFIITICIIFANSPKHKYKEELYTSIAYFFVLIYFILQYNITLNKDDRWHTLTFVIFYCVCIIFGNVYIHLRHKHYQTIVFICFVIWNLLTIILNILPTLDKKLNKDINSHEWFWAAIVILFVQQASLKGSYHNELSRRYMFVNTFLQSNLAEINQGIDIGDGFDTAELQLKSPNTTEIQVSNDSVNAELNASDTNDTNDTNDTKQDDVGNDEMKNRSENNDSSNNNSSDETEKSETKNNNNENENIGNDQENENLSLLKSPASIAPPKVMSRAVSDNVTNATKSKRKNENKKQIENKNDKNEQKVGYDQERENDNLTLNHVDIGLYRMPTVSVTRRRARTAVRQKTIDQIFGEDQFAQVESTNNPDLLLTGMERKHIRVFQAIGQIFSHMPETPTFAARTIGHGGMSIAATAGGGRTRTDTIDDIDQLTLRQRTRRPTTIANVNNTPRGYRQHTVAGVDSTGQHIVSSCGFTCVTKYDLQPWYRGYDYIIGGYRIIEHDDDSSDNNNLKNENGSKGGGDIKVFCKATASVFGWHNETGNIWTEIIPALVVVGINIYLIENHPFYWTDSDRSENKLISFAGWIQVVRAFLSAGAHNYHFVSEKYTLIWWSIDFLSIILTLTYFAIMTILMIFYCFSWTVKASIIFSYGMLALACTNAALLHDKNFREITFGLLGLAAVMFCFFHQAIIIIFYRFSDYDNFYGNIHLSKDNYAIKALVMWIFALISFVVAVVVRSLEYPEKSLNWNKLEDIDNELINIMNNSNRNDGDSEKINKERLKKTCADHLGTSHQWWHVLVNLGGLLSLLTLFAFLEIRSNHDTCQ